MSRSALGILPGRIKSPPPDTKGSGGGYIVFGTEPVGVGVKLLFRSVTLIPFGIFDDTW